VVAKFRHETSRERDPQLHTHALVLNLTMRSDGEWRALRNDGIVKATRYLGAVYRAELAAELQRAGYSLRHGRDGFFEFAHIDRAQLAAFSRRAERIEGRLAEAGLTRETASSEQTQRAALATRPRKVSADRQATFAEWRARAAELGIDFARREAELAAGDRVRITRNDAARDLANGDRFTVAAVNARAITLTDGRRQVELPTDRPLHLDHAYASTVHSSQGLTADRVLIDASTRSRTTSKDVFYVAISRAQQEARVYTDNRTKLPIAVEREHRKHAAMELERG
jgi:ATP-dependent exoDNAse (exonuclease V) alpha subunit